MSKEALQKLDKSIEQFLMLLSPYFLLKPAHKAMSGFSAAFSTYSISRFSMIVDLPDKSLRVAHVCFDTTE